MKTARSCTFRIAMLLGGLLPCSWSLAQETVEPPTAEEAGLTVQADEAVILPALRQLDVVGDEGLPAARPGDGPLLRREVPDVLQTQGFSDLVQGMVGQPVSLESLQRLQRLVQLELAVNGRPFSLVYLPEQDITGGSVRLVVRESRVGEVRVEGNRFFPADDYLQHIALQPDGPVDRSGFNSALDAISLNGYRTATIKVERGTEAGTSDVVIVTQERKPWSVQTGFNNIGTRSTDEERISAGATWGALFGSNHSASLNWSSDPGARHARALSGNYMIPLDAGTRLSLLAAYSELDAKVAAPLNQQGKNWQLGLNYDRTLSSPDPAWQHSLQLGLDFKASDNNLDYVLPPLSFAITNNLTHVVQARATYSAARSDTLGYTRGSVRLVVSPGGLSSANERADFEGTRAFAKPEYAYATLDLLRDTRLGGAFTGWNWTVRGAFQLASANLLGSEQFNAGGAASVRGYEESSSLGDNGMLLSHELILPPISVFDGLDQLRLFAFQDWSRASSQIRLPDEVDRTLHSVGIGLRYRLGNHLNVTLAQGWQLRDAPGALPGDEEHRLHLQFSLSY